MIYYWRKAPSADNPCATALYGSLLISGASVKYIVACYGFFSKHVQLYRLKTATTKACLNKLINNSFGEAVKHKTIICDNGSRFRSPLWKRKLNMKYKYAFERYGTHRAVRVKELWTNCQILSYVLSPNPQKLGRFIATDWTVVEPNCWQLYGVRYSGIYCQCIETGNRS